MINMQKLCGKTAVNMRINAENSLIIERIPRDKQGCVRLTPVTIYDIGNASTNSAFPNIPWGVPQVLLEKAV